MKIIVNMSDARVSKDTTDVLVTYSLGSCIGVTMYDPIHKVGGMLHYQLPNSKENANAPARNPYMFADTGLQLLVDQMLQQGADKKNIKVKVAGGAQMLNDAKMFSIGKRNHAAAKQLLWKFGMFVEKEEVGGQNARTIFLNVADGVLTVKSQGQDHVL